MLGAHGIGKGDEHQAYMLTGYGILCLFTLIYRWTGRTLLLASCCDALSERPHRCCHLANNIDSCRYSIYTSQCLRSERCRQHLLCVAISSLGISTRLPYVEPDQHWDGWPVFGRAYHLAMQPARSAEPRIPSGSLNRVYHLCWGKGGHVVSAG